MNLDDKCLLVLKPAEPFQHWLGALIESAQAAVRQLPQRSHDSLNIDIENIQYDSSCYLIPSFTPEKTAAYLEKHTQLVFSKELDNWCKAKEFWPQINFANFASCFNFDFYHDWLSFQKQEMSESDEHVKSIVLLVKPKEEFKDYLRPLLIEKYNVAPNEVESKLDMSLIQNGSTIVVTDINDLNDVEYFLDQHVEEIFTHQLIQWGGEEAQELWPRSLDLKAFKEWFTVEIHRNTYLMLH